MEEKRMEKNETSNEGGKRAKGYEENETSNVRNINTRQKKEETGESAICSAMRSNFQIICSFAIT